MNKEDNRKSGKIKWLIENGYTIDQATKIVNTYENFIKNNPSK